MKWNNNSLNLVLSLHWFLGKSLSEFHFVRAQSPFLSTADSLNPPDPDSGRHVLRCDWTETLYLEFTGHDELGRGHADEGVHAAEEQDGHDDGEVADQLPHLGEEDGQEGFRRPTSPQTTSIGW